MDISADIYDADELRDEIEGDLELLRQLVESFDRDFEVRMARLREAVREGDAERVRREGHALKGGMGLFYARTAAVTAATLEEMGVNGNLADALAGVEKLEQDVRILRAELDKLLKG